MAGIGNKRQRIGDQPGHKFHHDERRIQSYSDKEQSADVRKVSLVMMMVVMIVVMTHVIKVNMEVMQQVFIWEVLLGE